MRIFVAGATGALGRRLVPLLVEHGHEVVGMTRSADKAAAVGDLGAEPAVADGLDRDAVQAAVRSAEPEVIVHQMTALSGSMDMRHLDRVFATTNRLRTEGTDHLLAAAREVGARRLVAQSYTGWPNARTGAAVKTEEDPLDPDPPAAVRSTLKAIRYLESTVAASRSPEGIVLRYGTFYGPGNAIGPDGEIVEMVRKRRFPLVGGGTGVWSFVHIDDAAAATVAAVERGVPGIYNVTDDEPARVSDWLPALAAAAGAKPPMRVPAWLGRLAAGEAAVVMMTEARGSANAKARKELDWQPGYPSWRDGFPAMFR